MKPKVEILGIHDVDRKQLFFTNMVDTAMNLNMFPELTDTAQNRLDRVKALMQYSEFNNTVIAYTDQGAAFCIFHIEEFSTHAEGRVLVSIAMVSTGADDVLHALMKELRRFAKSYSCDWIAISHRVAPLEYRCKYRSLKRKSNE